MRELSWVTVYFRQLAQIALRLVRASRGQIPLPISSGGQTDYVPGFGFSSDTEAASSAWWRISSSKAICLRFAWATGCHLPVKVWQRSPGLAPHSGHSKSMAFMWVVYDGRGSPPIDRIDRRKRDDPEWER